MTGSVRRDVFKNDTSPGSSSLRALKGLAVGNASPFGVDAMAIEEVDGIWEKPVMVLLSLSPLMLLLLLFFVLFLLPLFFFGGIWTTEERV